MKKKYNTPHRSHVVKTRMTEEEYADFTERLKHYDMSQEMSVSRIATSTVNVTAKRNCTLDTSLRGSRMRNGCPFIRQASAK